MIRIAISRLHFPVTTLGPGRRIGIWFQGCSVRCPGCISADTWAFGRKEVSLDQVIERLREWLPRTDGVTVSGGEPFDQPQALKALLERLRALTTADILVYSGHSDDHLATFVASFHGLIDALISEPFVRDAPQSLPLRGSDNQKLHMLTPLGRKRFEAFVSGTPDGHALDVMFDTDGTVWLAGIPRRGEIARLEAVMAQSGHSILTTEDASARALAGELP
jgi:anaerobic ribonucleoside-triphosphate reductase activating protein